MCLKIFADPQTKLTEKTYGSQHRVMVAKLMDFEFLNKSVTYCLSGTSL